jgi:hypothetical protein
MPRGFRGLATDRSGFGLIELLIATCIGVVVLAILLQFAASAHTVTGVQGARTDVQQRLRVAVEALRHDLILAGAGPTRGPSRGPLNEVFAAVVPARVGLTGADPELSFHADRISTMYVPEDAPQSQLTSVMATIASPLAIDGAAPGCRPSTACDFSVGADVLVYEPTGVGGAYDVFTIAAIDAANNLLIPSAPLSRIYRAGTRVAAIVRRTYYLDSVGKRLMVYDGARSDLPLVDHVVDLQFVYYGDPRPDSVPPPLPAAANCVYAGTPPAPLLANLGGDSPKLLDPASLVDGPSCGHSPFRFDADLLRIRRVSFTVRLEAESAEFRGRGIAFSSPGAAPASTREIADLQTTVDVAPRNMARRIVIP